MKHYFVAALLILSACSGSSQLISEPFGEPYGGMFGLYIEHTQDGYVASEFSVNALPTTISTNKTTGSFTRAIVHYLNGSSASYAGEVMYCPPETDVCVRASQLPIGQGAYTDFMTIITPDTTHVEFYVQDTLVHTFIRKPSSLTITNIQATPTDMGYELSWEIDDFDESTSTLRVLYGKDNQWTSLLDLNPDYTSGADAVSQQGDVFTLTLTPENFKTTHELVDVRFIYSDGSQRIQEEREDFLSQLIPQDFDVYIDDPGDSIVMGNGVSFGIDSVSDPFSNRFGVNPEELFDITWRSERFPIPQDQVHDATIYLGSASFWEQPISAGEYTLYADLVHKQHPFVNKTINISFYLKGNNPAIPVR